MCTPNLSGGIFTVVQIHQQIGFKEGCWGRELQVASLLEGVVGNQWWDCEITSELLATRQDKRLSKH